MKLYCPECHALLTETEPANIPSNGPNLWVAVLPCRQHGGVALFVPKEDLA